MAKKYLLLIAVGITLIIANCSLHDPVLPTWFTPVTVPISGETFKLREIVNDSTIIIQGPDSLIFLSLDGKVDSTGLTREDLSFEPQSDSGAIQLNLLDIDSITGLRTNAKSLRELMPGLDSLVGQTVIIPETTIDLLSDILESEDFKRLHVKSGLVILRLHNDLPFPIGPNSTHSSIQFQIVNDSLNQQVTNLQINEVVPPGGTAETSDQIGNGGVWVYSKIRINYVLPIAQTTAIFVTDSLLDSSKFWLELDLIDFKADTAVAKIKSQTSTDVVKYELVSENRLKRAEIEQGRIVLDFQNHLPVGSKVVFSLPNIQTPQQQLFTDSLQIAELGSRRYEVVLDDFIIKNPDNPDAFIDSASIQIAIKTDSSDNFVFITDKDSISVRIQSDTLFLRSFTGYIAQETLELPGTEEDSVADYQDFPTGISLQDASLELSLLSQITIENFTVNLQVTGFHEENGVRTDSVTINLSEDLTSNGTPQNPDILNISVSGPEVAGFLNILPTSIRASGEVSFQGNADIMQSSYIWGEYLLSTPLKIKIENMIPIEGKVTTLGEGNVDEDVSDIADKHLESGRLILKLVNHTPLGGELQFMISADSNRTDEAFFDSTFFNPALEISRSAEFIAAPVDPATGFVSTPQISDVNLTLNSTELALLSRPPYRAAFRLKLYNTTGFVALRSTDYLKVFGLARVLVISDKD